MTHFAKKTFDVETDIPDLSEKVILVTGGNTGIGKETCLSFARHNPSHIYIAARNSKTAEATISEIRRKAPKAAVTFVQCDLASLSSVKVAAGQVLSQTKRLDILMCNAGILQPSGPPGLTEDGFELQFGTNHLGHALLIKLLLPLLLKTAEPHSDVRIVSTSSDGYRFHSADGIVFEDLRTTQENLRIFGFKSLGGWTRYFQSKLANIVYATELAKRYPSIKVVAVHPGVIDTELTPRYLKRTLIKSLILGGELKTPQEGSLNLLWAATGKGVESGQYYEPVGIVGKRTKKSKDEKLAKELWDWTQEQLETCNI